MKQTLLSEDVAPYFIWVCLKIVYPIVPNGFHDHYPYKLAISLGIYPTFSDKPILKKVH